MTSLANTSISIRSVHFYAPKFEEGEGAYWFGPVHGSAWLYVHACVTLAYGRERLEIGSWNLICGISMKIWGPVFFFLFRWTFHCRALLLFRLFFFYTLPLYAYGTLWTKCLENRLSKGHDIWLTDCVQSVDDLGNFWQTSLNIWLNYLPFPTLSFCVVKQPCKQNIFRTAWARIMISGIQFEYMM